MTAKKYFAKYKNALCDIQHPDRQKIAIGNLLDDFSKEQERESIKWRSCNRAIPNIVKDYNNKWNAIAGMVEKACGCEVLMRDGWSMYMGDLVIT